MNKFVIYGYNEFAEKLLKKKKIIGIISDRENHTITKKKKFKLKDVIKKKYNIIITTKSPQDIAAYHYLRLYVKKERIFNKKFRLFKNPSVCLNTKKITSNIKVIKNKISDYEVISFDLFETILDRKVSRPSDIYHIVSTHLNEKNYISHRENIEKKLLHKTKFKYSYNDIIKEFLCLKNYNKVKIQGIIDKEKEIELKLLFVRSEILDLVKFAKNKGKKVILVSDTHHDKFYIKKILDKFKINFFDKIYLSSEIGMSKFDKDIYYFLNHKYKNDLIHIGDNYVSDYINAKKQNIPSILIPNLNYIILNSRFSKIFGFNQDLFCKIFIGLIKYRISISMCKEIKGNKKYLFNDHNDFGYIFFGLLNFLIIIFISEISYAKKINKILLFSREGYYVKKGMEKFKKYFNFPSFEYFYTSRKISILSSLKEFKDISNSFLRHRYEGNIIDLLRTRFEIKEKNINSRNNFFIDTRNDKIKLNKILKKYEVEILSSALKTRERYLVYIDQMLNNEKNIAMFDQGFFGTTQSMIEKIMNRKFYGIFLSYYKKDKKRFGLFDYQNSNFRDLQVFFESLYTSLKGSVKNINSKHSFVFNKKDQSQRVSASRDKVFDGIFSFITDFNHIYSIKHNSVKLKINKEIINLADTLFGLFKEHKLIISPKIKKIFFHENIFVKKKKYVLKI